MAISYSKITQGRTWTVGTGTPATNGLTGSNGDEYTDSVTGQVYTYVNGSWALPDLATESFTIYVKSEVGVDISGGGDLKAPYLTIDYALTQINNTGTVTLNTTNTSTTISGISDAHNALLEVGMIVSGTGIPFNTYIRSKGNEGGNANTIIISKNATSTNTAITATYIKIYILECSGYLKPTSNIFKEGVYIKNNGTIEWGNFTLFSNSSILKSNYFILGDGQYIGVHNSSIFASLSGTQTAAFNLGIYFDIIDSIGTGTCITTSTGTNENYTEIKGKFVNARFGTVCSLTGYSNKIDFDSYGLLGGLTTVNSTTSSSPANNTIYGTHQTPAAVSVLNAGTMTISYGNYRGNVTFGNSYSSHIGRISGTSHTLAAGSNIKAIGRSSGAFTCSSYVTIEFSNPSEICSLIVNSGAKVTARGEYTLSATNNLVGELYNYGVILTATLKGTGTLYNNGELNITETNGFNGTIENYGNIISAGFVPTTGGLIIKNYGKILMSSYGMIFNGASKVFNYGTIESNGAFTNNSCMIKLNSTSCVFDNYGRIISNDTDITDSLIDKTSGTLFLRQGSYLKVSNGRSPIRCTANNTDSKNIYMFSTTTNCDGSTYGLLIAFDGSSFTPNDLVGGDLYENVIY
jgi:hypothetical protein